MRLELDKFKATLARKDVLSALAYAEELAIKQQFAKKLKSTDLGDEQIEALLNKEQPLQFLFENYLNQEQSGSISVFSELMRSVSKDVLTHEGTTTSANAQDGELLKYEITDIAHPKYPWLHRIRALRDIGGLVHKGNLGGFVQSTDNLSQNGDCWLFGMSIACEEALITQNAQVSEYAVIRGNALVTGSADISSQAVVEDYAIVTDGYIEGCAQISGNARIGTNQNSHLSPWIMEKAVVYGEIYGNVIVCDQAVVLPGTKIDLSTTDTLHIRTDKVEMTRDAKRILRDPNKTEVHMQNSRHSKQER